MLGNGYYINAYFDVHTEKYECKWSNERPPIQRRVAARFLRRTGVEDEGNGEGKRKIGNKAR